MSSRSASAHYPGFAGTLPMTVATVYMSVAIVATTLGFVISSPAAFLPLLLLSAPFGVLLLDSVDTMNLFLQSVFVATGVAINAWLFGMVAAGLRSLRRRRR
ncbi:MAG: hypothetical protein U1E40_14070 [Amaricoccus sp.]